jgi:hypothetical protein
MAISRVLSALFQGDRICIMSQGSIQALGSSIRLKQKFGTGYRLTIFYDKSTQRRSQDDAVKHLTALVSSVIEDSSSRTVAPGILEFDIPRSSRTAMPALFTVLKQEQSTAAATAGLIKDVSISLATLEDVFLNLSRNELAHALEVDEAASSSSAAAQAEKAEKAEKVAEKVGSNMEFAARGAPKSTGKTGFCAQFHALSHKTMVYQKRQKCQSGCLICFPIFCIAMLLLVQLLLNNLNPTKDYDFTCINDKFQQNFIHGPYGNYETCASAQCLSVGDPSLLNPHGGDNSELSYYQLHYSLSHQCASHGNNNGDNDGNSQCNLGALTRQVPLDLFQWYHALVDQLYVMQSCNDQYEKYLHQHVDVNNAAKWEQEYNPNGQAGYSPTAGGMGFNFNDCKTNSKSGASPSSSPTTAPTLSTVRQALADSDGGGASWKPTPVVLKELHTQQQVLKQCQTNYLRSTMQTYAALPVPPSLLAEGGANNAYVTNHSHGILNGITTTNHDSPLFATYKQYVTLTLLSIFQHNATCYPTTDTTEYTGTTGTTGTTGMEDVWSVVSSFLTTPDLAQPCSLFESSVVASLYNQILLPTILAHKTTCATSIAMSEEDLVLFMNTLESFCWVQNSKDTFRNLSFVPIDPTATTSGHAQTKALDALLLAQWSSPTYNTHVKYSIPGTYTFRTMDTRHRNYSYVAWYNVTGSDSGFSFQSNGQSNWMGLIATMNAAIYKHDTQGGVMTITRAPWPTLYTKENILGVFGEFSIIDLVGGFFFPFVLFMLMPIIMSMVMYEKEYRLREVMKMMGLRMNVYWVVTYLLFLAEYSLLCTVFWVFGAMASKYSTALLLGTCVSIQFVPTLFRE